MTVQSCNTTWSGEVCSAFYVCLFCVLRMCVLRFTYSVRFALHFDNLLLLAVYIIHIYNRKLNVK